MHLIHPLYQFFRKWWHFAKFNQLERLHLHRVQEIKHQKIQQLTLEAQQAFEHHDSFKLFHVISKSCPKRTKRIHLKGDDGSFLTPTEETAAYVHYIEENWKGPPLQIPTLPPPGIPFTLTELEQAISLIPTTKAVAPGFAPGPMWKSQSHFIATWLFDQLTEWWNQSPPYIPPTWKDAWACWLPKPQKPATKLVNLRMLGLQEPLGKAVLKLLAQKALSQTLSWLSQYPQFAYLPYRSTKDALLRGACHRQAVRTLLTSQQRSIHASIASEPRLACAELPRPVIMAALQRAQLDPKLQNLILTWHTDTNYHIEVNNTCRCVPVSRGVRQGCSIAPYLWAVTMAMLLDDLQLSIPRQWILDHITIFADDIHAFCAFRNSHDLCLAVQYFEQIIAAIERLGLTLSPSKSCVIIRGKGTGFEKWKRRFIVGSATNSHLLLNHGTLKIPVQKKTFVFRNSPFLRSLRETNGGA